jgi:hypothetical protein
MRQHREGCAERRNPCDYDWVFKNMSFNQNFNRVWLITGASRGIDFNVISSHVIREIEGLVRCFPSGLFERLAST